MSKWEIIRNFFNSKKSNKVFTRREYFTIVKFLMVKNKLTPNNSYIDTCRCYLQEAGYLKTEEAGVYRKVKPIPKDLTSTQCYKQAYKK